MTSTPPVQVRAAAVLVGVEALLGVVTAVLYVFFTGRGIGTRLVEASYFALIGAALAAVAVLLYRGRHGARTPAIVTQLLLIPMIYNSLSTGDLVVGFVALFFVVGTFLLLISEPSRRWVLGADEESRSE
ncbi:hypothetical protein [Pseudonocardia xishanensis]|uniref:Integral membrane protein n=1 Tax=Pseudonocardia xishanensis TaxID=630995 RepID=A0ABP8RU57_9PSEU